MTKTAKKTQKKLEKALKAGNWDEMMGILMEGGKNVHVEFDTDSESKKEKKKEAKPEKEKAGSGVKIAARPAGFDYTKYLNDVEKEDKRYEQRMKKCKEIAESQREKILESNPTLDESDIDIDEMAKKIYEGMYEKKSA